jgi:hypothetical protein
MALPPCLLVRIPLTQRLAGQSGTAALGQASSASLGALMGSRLAVVSVQCAGWLSRQTSMFPRSRSLRNLCIAHADACLLIAAVDSLLCRPASSRCRCVRRAAER